jgi:hypothetical protein
MRKKQYVVARAHNANIARYILNNAYFCSQFIAWRIKQMLKIHHNTEKRAHRLGIELVVVDDEIVASRKGAVLASGLAGNTVLEQAVANLQVQAVKIEKPAKVADSADRHAIKLQNELTKRAAKQKPARVEADDEPKTASVISARFREKYSEHGGSCGDDLAAQLSTYIAGTDKDGKACVDVVKLERVATPNGVWKPEYATATNSGLSVCPES